MRQYYIFYKRAGAAEMSKLQPLENRTLYDREKVNLAVDFMRREPSIRALAVQLDDEQFQLFAFEQEAEGIHAFKFDEPVTTPVDETLA